MEERVPDTAIDKAALRVFFIEHLNRVYCAKDKLADKLPLLASQAAFLDLHQAIAQTVEEVLQQLDRMRHIFILLDSYYEPASCPGLAGILDEAFQSIGPRAADRKLRDLSILFYMQTIESIETSTFKILQLAAMGMERGDVEQLILECYDEAREDTELYKQIMRAYVK